MKLPSRERWSRIEALFAEALVLSAQERDDFLAARVEDPELRADVARLLAAHDRAEGYLEELDTARAAALVHAVDDGLAEGEVVGPYQLVRPLGRGGMGVVWLAHDPRLDRPVAVKLLAPHLSGAADARRRMTEEAKAASALDHPGIGTIYDIGEAPDGGVFIAMAFHEGESLRERLDAGLLSVDEALGVATQIADALSAAHAAGIVHRDVKPGNVLVTPSGAVKLVDFGVAKLPGPNADPARSAGGTPPYMSPEQTREGQVGPGSDVWAMGVLLYEMLAGRRPFRGPGSEQLVEAIRHGDPEPIGSLRPDVPAQLANVVARCLAKDPAERWADGAELRDALEAVERERADGGGRWSAAARVAVRPVAGVAVVTVAATIVAIVLRAGGSDPGGEGVPVSIVAEDAAAMAPQTRLAVLPFVNLGAVPGEEYFADGLTEELIGKIARLPNVRVIARSSVMAYRDADRDLAEIAGELGVATLLEGGVRRSGDRVRITVRLVDAESRELLWTEEYDAEVGDVVVVQQEIAGRVAAALRIQFDPETWSRAPGARTSDAEAYILYLHGRHVLHRRTEEAMRQAAGWFEEAIERDPNFAGAHAGLAQAYFHLGNYGFLPTDAAHDRAARAVERALALDDANSEAHAVNALLLAGGRDFAEAEAAFQAALVRRPGDAQTRHWYGFLLATMDRTAEALDELRLAHALDPLGLAIAASLGRVLVHAGQEDAAADLLLRAIELDETYPWTWYALALAHAGRDRREDASAALTRALERAPDHPRLRAANAVLEARAGSPDRARAILIEPDASGTEALPAFERALVHAALGNADATFRDLTRASWGSETLFSLRTDPLLAPVRPDPRYVALLRELGL